MNQIKRVWIPADSFYAEEESCPARDVQVVLASDYDRHVADLTAKLASTEGALDAYGRDNAALTRRLEEAQRNSVPIKYFKVVQVNDPHSPVAEYMAETHDGEFVSRSVADALQAKLAAVERERDTTRTALLALPVVVKELEQALDVLDDYYDGAEDSRIKWLGEPMYYVRNAKERLAQAMRGGE